MSLDKSLERIREYDPSYPDPTNPKPRLTPEREAEIRESSVLICCYP